MGKISLEENERVRNMIGGMIFGAKNKSDCKYISREILKYALKGYSVEKLEEEGVDGSIDVLHDISVIDVHGKKGEPINIFCNKLYPDEKPFYLKTLSLIPASPINHGN